MFITILIVFGLGVIAGRRVFSAVDFSVSGRKAGTALVAGTIRGTLVGGASTVGTAQLAFMYGLSAWWFTLGGGIACLFIALFLARPMRETRFETIPQFLSSGYSPLAGVLAALFVSLGMFINIVPQVFSSIALVMPLFPLGEAIAALLTVILMILYVIFGGLWGTGLMGVCKVLLTTLSLGVGGALAFQLSGGFYGLAENFPPYPWFSLFGRGVNTDLAAAFSLLVGVLSSQIYFQAIFSSRSLAAARAGALISALLGPAIGAGGILIGLYMRVGHPEIVPAQALPLFMLNYLHPLLSGIVFATLILVTIATGAGLTLGISTMVSRDIYQHFFPKATEKQILLMFRLMIVAIAALVFTIVYSTGSDAIILQWSYLSLGLRGATVCFPLLAVIFLRTKVSAPAGTLAVLLGPLSVIAFSLSSFELNPLYPGLAVSLTILTADYLLNAYRKKFLTS
jgi:solute:Na+ symporter, SSS family